MLRRIYEVWAPPKNTKPRMNSEPLNFNPAHQTLTLSVMTHIYQSQCQLLTALVPTNPRKTSLRCSKFCFAWEVLRNSDLDHRNVLWSTVFHIISCCKLQLSSNATIIPTSSSHGQPLLSTISTKHWCFIPT